MSLRTKAIVLLSMALIAIVTLVYGSSRIILINGLSRIEKYLVEQSVQRALNVLSQTDSEMETTLTDWAVWDDTYVFIHDRNSGYVQRNLTDSTFSDLKLNLMLFLDSSGGTVFTKEYDLDNGEEIPVSPQLTDDLKRSQILGTNLEQKMNISGIVLFDEGPMLVCSQPILKSDYSGPDAGTLVFGRFLNGSELNRIDTLTLSSISLVRIDGHLDSEETSALRALKSQNQVYVHALDKKNIAGYTMLNDLSGRPALILKVAEPRDVSALGQYAVLYHILAILGVGLLITSLVLLALQKQVLSRFTSILGSLRSITLTGDTTTKLPVGGNDEITLMARTINGMLASIEESSVELRAREERYRLLAENAQDVIFTTDMNLNFRYLSPSISSLSGYMPEDTSKKSFYDLLTSASAETVREVFSKECTEMQNQRSNESDAITMELQVMRKDGVPIWVEAKINMLFGDKGTPDGFLGVIRDISERKRADIALTNMYESEKKLRQELQAEIEKRTEYTRALVHELKTPITPIMAAADILTESIKEPPLSNLVQSINRSAFNLNRRVDELLDLARSELKILRIYPENTNLVTLLADIANDMIPVGLSKGLTVSADLPRELPVVNIDKDRIKQVILNLMNNAIKFTPSGGKIALNAKQVGDELIISLNDSGSGISKEKQKGIFDPYHLVPDDLQRLSGLGLGLTLAKQFVELHGGRLWVESEQGRGSTFSFSLPVAFDTRDNL